MNKFHVLNLVRGPEAAIVFTEEVKVYVVPYRIRPFSPALNVHSKMVPVHMVPETFVVLSCQAIPINGYRDFLGWLMIG
jgi:hypothetical protein